MGSSANRRALRLAGAIFAALAVLIALAAVAVPLVLRGRRLGALIERNVRPRMCGKLSVAGGRLGLAAVPQLLFGWPVPFQIDGLRLVAPGDDEVLAAARISGSVVVRRTPLRIEVIEIRIASAKWKLEQPRRGAGPFVQALRPTCGDERRPTMLGARPGRPSQPGVAVQIHQVHLDDVDVTLAFPTWALALAGTSAEGSLTLSAQPGVPRLQFQARCVRAARGGALRVGHEGHRFEAKVPFDDVRITRVGTAGEGDLLLEVERASTGRSVLSGRALFGAVFPWARSVPPSLQMSARWAQVGDAVETLLGRWGFTPPTRLDGDIDADLNGRFDQLAGRLRGQGKHASFDGELVDGRDLRGAIRLDRAATAPWIPSGLDRMLGGHVSGVVEAHGRLAARPPDASAQLDRMALRLDRAAGGPRWIGLYSRQAAPKGELAVSIGDVKLERGELAVEDVRAALFGARVHADLVARPLADPAHWLAGTWGVAGIDLDRLIPGDVLGGRLALAGRIEGAPEALSVEATVEPGTSLRLWGHALTPPKTLKARFTDGHQVELARIQFGAVSGGAIELGGRLDLRGHLDGRLALRRFVPAGLPLSGRVDGALHVVGPLEHPSLDGTLAWSDVIWRDAPLGSGAVAVTAAPGGATFEGRVVPGLSARGRIQLGAVPTVVARFDLHDLAMPPSIEGLAARVTGAADLELRGREYLVKTDLGAVVIAYGGLDLGNVGPVRLQLTEEEARLESVRLVGSGADVELRGRFSEGQLQVKASGQVALAALDPVMRSWSRETTGVLDFSVRASGALDDRRLAGTVRVVDPVRLWPALLPRPIEIRSARIAFDGPQVTLTDGSFSVVGAIIGASGQVRLDLEGLADSTVDLALVGDVDADAVARRFPARLSSAKGHARVEARVRGPLGAPTFDGSVDLTELAFPAANLPLALRRLDGRIEAAGRRVTTRGLVAELAPAGRVSIGSPAHPAIVEVDSLFPLAFGAVEVGIEGRHLSVKRAVPGLEVRDADLDLRLSHTSERPFILAGDLRVAGAHYAQPKVTRARATKLPDQLRRVEKGLPGLTLDLRLRSAPGALEIAVPVLPDVNLTFDCRITGPIRTPTLSGSVRGDGAYSRMAFSFYDWLKGGRFGRCGAKPL